MNIRSREFALDGEWDFTFTPEGLDGAKPPEADAYDVALPVPGYWDDSREQLQYATFWSADCQFNPEYREISFPIGAGKPVDTSLPYLLGTGWYRTRVVVPGEWSGSTATLFVGGVVMDAAVWVNGAFVDRHEGHLTPFEVELGEHLLPGENELLLAVSNVRQDSIGCNIRGFAGRTGGIYRSVRLRLSDAARIGDVYVHPSAELDRLSWSVELRGHAAGAAVLEWEVVDRETGNVRASGRQPAATHGRTIWTTDTCGMRPWSDREPVLYDLRVRLRDADAVVDECEQPFGMRRMATSGRNVLLNGAPVFLRGSTEHAYFPETCTAPTDVDYYRSRLRTLRGLGFNWLRFHTWTPPEEYLQAADEEGMLLQVEAPNGFSEREWLDILRTCRRHPSVIMYCCGNEVPLDDAVIDRLGRMAQHQRELAPDTLFDPMEGLVEIEHGGGNSGVDAEPGMDPDKMRRLQRMSEYADVLAPNGRGIFSYYSAANDETSVETCLSYFERPIVLHELGISDTYLNLDLENRYLGTRIGPDLYRAAREFLTKRGIVEMAPIYYRNSCRWMQQIIKFAIENARRSGYASGYDLLGAIDFHWHRTGYAVGLMNEFYELKPGLSVESVRAFNGESVLLSTVDQQRNLTCGQTLEIGLLASLFGRNDLDEDGVLSWALVADDDVVLSRGSQQVGHLATGAVTPVAKVQAEVPHLRAPGRLRFVASLSGGEYELRNTWEFWAFPAPGEETPDDGQVRIVSRLDAETIAHLAAGGDVLVEGDGALPSQRTTFQIIPGGRVHGNSATVVHDHAMIADFPHEGFCDWQFYPLFEGGRSVVLDDLGFEVESVVDVVGTYKLALRKSALFEVGVGAGRLVVCGLKLDAGDSAGRYLRSSLLKYLATSAGRLQTRVSPEELAAAVGERARQPDDFSTDEGYDDGGHVRSVQL
ncbi:glycoside hydrolase family 2 protein [Phytoactinopolyspora endophytica]|uniref:glycoside hydrolase family 2 protein n=1 Tax=Phytoactinopolyspora endophytica TaxID=1642495 RepID=UPI00101DA9C6|nr:sugar-binding domain-containing protein [Phytoactinopolyspora endophytica]